MIFPTISSFGKWIQSHSIHWSFPLQLIAFVLLFPFLAVMLPATPVRPEHTTDAGDALYFDGHNDYVELHYTSEMLHSNWADTKSVSLWVKPESSSSCVLLDPAMCESIFGTLPRWWGISIGTIAGEDKIWIWNFDGNYDRIGVDFTPGEWVHITLVHDAGILRAYRNGFQVGDIPSGTTLQPIGNGDTFIYMGGVITGDGTAWTFNGELDEVRIWNYARSLSQVRDDLNHEIPGDSPGLVAYYKMSNGSGDVLTDDTGNGWDGVLKDGNQNVPPDGHLPEWVPSTAFSTIILTPTYTHTPTNTPTSTSSAPGPTPSGTPFATVTGTPPSPAPTGTQPGPTPTGTVGSPGPTPDDYSVYMPVIQGLLP